MKGILSQDFYNHKIQLRDSFTTKMDLRKNKKHYQDNLNEMV